MRSWSKRINDVLMGQRSNDNKKAFQWLSTGWGGLSVQGCVCPGGVSPGVCVPKGYAQGVCLAQKAGNIMLISIPNWRMQWDRNMNKNLTISKDSTPFTCFRVTWRNYKNCGKISLLELSKPDTSMGPYWRVLFFHTVVWFMSTYWLVVFL